MSKKKCPDCENCKWAPDKDCRAATASRGEPDHPHCERCGHCKMRHGPWVQP